MIPSFLSPWIRASEVGLAVLLLSSITQWALNSRVPANWRVWLWRVALLQTAFALIPLSPIHLALLSPSPKPKPETKSVVASPPTAKSSLAPSPPPSPPPSTEDSSPTLTSLPHIPDTTSAAVFTAPTSAPISSPPRRAGFNWQSWLMAIYIAGIATHLLLLWRSAVRIRRTLRSCKPVHDSLALTLLQQSSSLLPVRTMPRLLLCEEGAPFLVGILRPAIVLPASLLSANNPHLEAVLAHELAHAVRRDLAWNVVLWLIGTLFWFHPLAWVARRFHSLEVESACDELVLQTTHIAPRSYGQLLLRAMNFHQSPLTAGVNDGFFALKTRLSRLSLAPSRPKKVLLRAFAAALVLSFGALVPFRLVARAQNVEKAVGQVRGVVRDEAKRPIAGAKVYAMTPRVLSTTPLEMVVTDANGAFQFSPKIGRQTEIIVDAGAKGLAQNAIFKSGGNIHSIPIVVTAPSRLTIRCLMTDLKAKARPVSGLKVDLWRVGYADPLWLALPSPVLKKMQGTTNANGEVSFDGLPGGMTAQFWITQKHPKTGADRGRWTREFLLRAPKTKQNAILFAYHTTLAGRVALPNGQNATGATVRAYKVTGANAPNPELRIFDSYVYSSPVDSSGRYSIGGLLTGSYVVWVDPGSKLGPDWLSPTFHPRLWRGANYLNVTLSQGAFVEGVVLSQKTKKPVLHQTMMLKTEQNGYEYKLTDERGFFRFRVFGGPVELSVHANGTNSPPPGFLLPVNSKFDFSIKNGQKRTFHIELPEIPTARPITGQVVGPDGKAIAGASIAYNPVGSSIPFQRSLSHQIKSDANGRFSLPLDESKRPVQLFADAGELVTTHSTIALGGDDVTLQVEANSWASVKGRVLDGEGKGLPNVGLTFHSTIANRGGQGIKAVSDANGRFHFDHLRPGTGFVIYFDRPSYTSMAIIRPALTAGQTQTVGITMKRADSTLRGIVIGLDGRPAANYNVDAPGKDRRVVTRADGRFYMPHIFGGPLTVWVMSPPIPAKQIRRQYEFRAQGGDNNLVLRLKDAKSVEEWSYARPQHPRAASLVGQVAPEIRIERWLVGNATTLSALRGKTVLLSLANFDPDYDVDMRDAARSLGERVQIVGVQNNFARFKNARISAKAIAGLRSLGFPIAFDAASQVKRSWGKTSDAYGGAKYIVIAPDGKVAYAGDELSSALTYLTTVSGS